MTREFLSAFKVPLLFLKSVGLWKWKTWKRLFFGLILHFVLVETIIVTHVVHSLILIKEQKTKELADTLSVLFTVIGVFLKTVWFLSNSRAVMEMLEDLQKLLDLTSFERNGQRPILQSRTLHIIKISKFYYGSALISTTSACLVALMRYRERVLPYETHLLYDIDGHFAYFATVAHQYLMACYGSMVNYSLDLVLVIFLNFLLVIIEELLQEIKLMEDSPDGDAHNKLKLCINCHVVIRQFAFKLAKNLTQVFFIQALLSSTILCTSIFYLSLVSEYFAIYFPE